MASGAGLLCFGGASPRSTIQIQTRLVELLASVEPPLNSNAMLRLNTGNSQHQTEGHVTCKHTVRVCVCVSQRGRTADRRGGGEASSLRGLFFKRRSDICPDGGRHHVCGTAVYGACQGQYVCASATWLPQPAPPSLESAQHPPTILLQLFRRREITIPSR